MKKLGRLVVLPGLRAVQTPQGRVVVTRKFLDGMSSYAARWDGDVAAYMDASAAPSNDLDHVEVDPAELPFELRVVPYGSRELWTRLAGAGAVLGGPDYRLPRLAGRLRRMHIASVSCVEYTLRTRLACARVESRNVLRGARRALWELGFERAVRREIRESSAVQCNGIPTYDAYAKVNPSRLLYFDTRVPGTAVATPFDVGRRHEVLRAGRPLRLAFSGRLIAMKGVDHLVPMAVSLVKRGVPFELTICGDGELGPALKRDVERFGLKGSVRLAGVLSFEKELLPFLRERVDVFVAPHRQGDPSCTYLETLACGVPILGYANEALAGIVDRAPVGWTTPMDRPERLAAAIASLHEDRDEIIAKSAAALPFAREHTFERTFDRRVAHLAKLAVATAA